MNYQFGDKVLVNPPKDFRKFLPEWIEGKVISITPKAVKVYTEARGKIHPYPFEKVKTI